jgi:fucose permease
MNIIQLINSYGQMTTPIIINRMFEIHDIKQKSIHLALIEFNQRYPTKTIKCSKEDLLIKKLIIKLSKYNRQKEQYEIIKSIIMMLSVKDSEIILKEISREVK